MNGNILIIGAGGQVGQELTEALRIKYGQDQVIATDIQFNSTLAEKGPFEVLDVLDKREIDLATKKYKVNAIFHLAAILSAKGEQKPQLAWKINMDGLLNVLDVAKENKIEKVFWPSSIAVFGPGSPKENTPQNCFMDPNTVYGISKLAGERWCAYYFENFGIDVRSLRYPGLIGYKAAPGGGTTDYAVEIFHEALTKGRYTCFLKENAALPMLYMPDAIRATIELMEAPKEAIGERGSYNLAGISFSPSEIEAAIRRHLPAFSCDYKPDFRQAIAESWPQSVDDSQAMNDWGWQPEYDLSSMTKDMLVNLKEVYNGEPIL